MSGEIAVQKKINIQQNEDWVCGPFRYRDSETKLPLDFSAYTGTDIQMQIKEDKADEGGASLVTLTIANAGVVLVPTIVGATALNTAFTASTTLVVTGATFDSDGVQAGDLATIAGSTSNDSARRVVSVTDEETLVLDGAAFTAEAAAGTVTITNESRFQLEMSAATTDALDFTNDRAVYDLYVLISGLSKRTMEGSAHLSRTVTR